MQKIVTANEMAQMDKKTIEEIGIPGAVLMEVAGRGITDEIKNILEQVRSKNVVIYCGKGNNGGDGYVIARHLKNAGAAVSVMLAGKKENIQGDALINLQILEKLNIHINEIESIEDIEHPPHVDLVVDALLGTGVTGPVKGFYAELIKYINLLGEKAAVVSVDLPTGMETDTGNVLGDCVTADATVTMAHIKTGMLFSPAREHTGKITVVDIGIPPEVSTELHGKIYLTEIEDIKKRMPQRKPDAHKTSVGKIAVLAGSVGMTGAATLTARSTLQVGAGLTKLGIPESLNTILEQKLTEVMTIPLSETDRQSVSLRANNDIGDLLDWADIIAMGPGLTTHEETVEFVKWILQNADKPLVLDADGLNALRGAAHLLKTYKNELVITPHPGELSRLIDKSISDIVTDRINVLREIYKEMNAVIVLKGAPTTVIDKDGAIYINSTGNPGLATGGTGDVLTGIIAGLWAQGLSAIDAAICGVYIQGLSGDLAADELSEMAMTAGDLNAFLPDAIRLLENS
ncbi:NAD(P)H-hydrate dehydratase [candidate division KSB1 bacterium]|nr:NAD(P)H-hydrate dehydratase [candidate division KSB1 bacterium]